MKEKMGFKKTLAKDYLLLIKIIPITFLLVSTCMILYVRDENTERQEYYNEMLKKFIDQDPQMTKPWLLTQEPISLDDLMAKTDEDRSKEKLLGMYVSKLPIKMPLKPEITSLENVFEKFTLYVWWASIVGGMYGLLLLWRIAPIVFGIHKRIVEVSKNEEI